MDTGRHNPWRSLPSERVLWEGRPVRHAPRETVWTLGPLLLLCTATIPALCACLLAMEKLPGATQMLWLSVYFTAFGLLVGLAPSYLHDDCEYMLTDKRILWRRGRYQRWIDASALSYTRIHWNRRLPNVGHLELVRATPFGPLLRRQRLILRNVRDPGHVLALLRGMQSGPNLDDAELPLIDRLDPNERIVWGGAPHGWLLSVRNLATIALALGVLASGWHYSGRAWAVLLHLEGLGLQVRSWTWLLMFSMSVMSSLLMLGIGALLLWHGLWRARALGHQTEYVITDRRVVIRRGRTELYLNRRYIVDAAVVRVGNGVRHLYLILDSPEGRALSDSGALTGLPPARDIVAPVLYELNDADAVRRLLLAAPANSPGPAPGFEDAA